MNIHRHTIACVSNFICIHCSMTLIDKSSIQTFVNNSSPFLYIIFLIFAICEYAKHKGFSNCCSCVHYLFGWTLRFMELIWRHSRVSRLSIFQLSFAYGDLWAGSAILTYCALNGFSLSPSMFRAISHIVHRASISHTHTHSRTHVIAARVCSSHTGSPNNHLVYACPSVPKLANLN